MAIDAFLLRRLTQGTATEAWTSIRDKAVEISSRPFQAGLTSDIARRDRDIGDLDHFLSSAGWDLWQLFGEPEKSGIDRTSERLIDWWGQPHSAKAVLILDGLSLREMPWLLQGANDRGFVLHDMTAHASELPGETNEFAQALGFGSRSQLQNNGGGLAHRLLPAQTECVNMPWKDCEGLINNASGAKNWIFWHHWPDSTIHSASGAGQGLDVLAPEAADQLRSDDFWSFVERLATGRRLVITSDHGYAATGYFPDADSDVGQFLKSTFASGRNTKALKDVGPFVPPVAMSIHSKHGQYVMAVGRRKWKSQGGYPTLTHGGLSLLEVLTPWIEITKTGD